MIHQTIQQLKIHRAKQILQQGFGLLNIESIVHADDESGKVLFTAFRQSGIWHYDNKPIALFAFDNNKQYHSQHNTARQFFIQKIKTLHSNAVWILLSQHGFEFFVQISLSTLCQHLDGWFDKYDDFVLFIPNQYVLAIHDGEYAWEVLEKILTP